MNFFSRVSGAEFTRRFGDLRRDAPCKVRLDEPGLLGGMYRVILLEKTR